jgi:hypothetical protein
MSYAKSRTGKRKTGRNEVPRQVTRETTMVERFNRYWIETGCEVNVK